VALDGHVRCNCVREGVAKAHPFPGKLTFDHGGEPVLNEDASDEEWDAHDLWLGESCEHGGFLLSLPLGNITRIAHLREFLRGLEGNPGPRFPLLLKKVIYDGTHSGDSFPRELVQELLKEVETVLHSSDILSDSEKEFFVNMKELCQASIETGNAILF
jgi:hypothetical protein